MSPLAALVVGLLLGGALAAPATVFLLRQRRRMRTEALRRHQEANPPPPPPAQHIPTVQPEAFEPRFAPTELGPTLAAEVAVVPRAEETIGATSDTEALILAGFAKGARRMFEFGTATGRTTYMWARNSPPDAHVTTLTLAPDQVATYQSAEGDLEGAARYAASESAFTRFLYSGTDVEGKVTQLYGDSKAFDEGPYAGQCDLIFVDGSHAYSYVQSDSEKALRMLRPGGVVLWHDYRDPAEVPEVLGVVEYLNALRNTLPLVRLGQTTLVAYRKPADAPAGSAAAA